MFFGVRLRSLFTSRWFALLWAVLVLLTAIQFVGPGDDSQGAHGSHETADGLTNDQRAALANTL